MARNLLEEQRQQLQAQPINLLQQQRLTQQPDVSRVQTGLESVGRGLTFGALPIAQAAAEPAMTSVLNLLTGQQVEPGTFQERVAENVQRQAAQREAFPIQAIGSEMLGNIPLLATGGGLAARGLAAAPQAIRGALSGITGRALGAAGTGAATGLLQQPEISPTGEVPGLQLPERLSQARSAATSGLLFQAGGEALRGVGRAAPGLALRAAGFSKAQLKRAFRKFGFRGAQKKQDEIAATILDNRLVRAGDTPEIIADRVEDFLTNTGTEISQLNQQVTQGLTLQNLGRARFDQLSKGQLTPANIRNDFLRAVRQEFKGKAGRDSALAKARQIASQIDLQDIGIDDIAGLQRFRRSLDELINFNVDTPAAQRVALVGRQFLKDKIFNRLQQLDDIVGTKNVKELRRLNKMFSNLAELEEASIEAVSRTQGNVLLGLRGTIVGAEAGAALKSPLGGLLAATGLRGLQRRALPVLTRGAQLGGLLGQQVTPLRTGIAAGLLQQNPPTTPALQAARVGGGLLTQ